MFVVEIGSNDGIMFKHFAKRGIKHLGIEPSSNVVEVAKVAKGINTITEFFDEKVADKIIEKIWQGRFLFRSQCHVSYSVHSLCYCRNKKTLKPKGLLIFEDPYLGDILEKTSYDQIYDEHAFSFQLNQFRI